MKAISCLAVGFPSAELQGLKMARPLELEISAAADNYDEARSILKERIPDVVAIYGTKQIALLKEFAEFVKASDDQVIVALITGGNGEGVYSDLLIHPSGGCAYIADSIIEAASRDKAKRPELIKLSRERILDERIANIFISAGIPPHIKGYQFLREAVKQTVKLPEMINNITKELYPAVAEKFATSPSKVERAIRHAIEVAWSRGKIENINNIYGIKIFGKGEKPTNGELIALIADKLMIEYS